jgi:hypothetical protein
VEVVVVVTLTVAVTFTVAAVAVLGHLFQRPCTSLLLERTTSRLVRVVREVS